MLTGVLVKRLRLVADRARHPEIADEVITAPVFIVGQPRSGSTHLHALLACVAGFRAPLVLGDVGAVAAPGPRDVRHRPSHRRGPGDGRPDAGRDAGAAPDVGDTPGAVQPADRLDASSTRRGWRRSTSARTASGSSTPTTRRRTRRTSARCSSCSGATPAGGCSSTRSTCSRSTRCSRGIPDAVLIWTHRDPAAVLPSAVSLTGYHAAVEHARLRPRAVRPRVGGDRGARVAPRPAPRAIATRSRSATSTSTTRR